MRSTSEDYQRTHRLEPRLAADLRWVRDSLNTFTMTVSAQYRNNRSEDRQTTEQEEAVGSDYVPTLSQLTATHTDGHETNLSARAGWEHYVKDGSLGATLRLNYQDGKTDGQTERTITAHKQTYTSSQLHQTYTSPSTRFSTYAEAHHSRWLTKIWMMQLQYSLTYNRDHNDQDFMTDGVADAANSYRIRYNRHEHNLQLSQTINLSPVQLMPKIAARWQRESQDYQRGLLDTTAVRRQFFINPSLKATWKLTKTAGFELNYSFNTRQPDLIQTIGFRDLTDPLFINEGNPNLKDTHTHDVKLTYNMVISRSQTSLSTSIGFNGNDRETTTALNYDPTTAVYESRPENIRGSKSWNFQLNLDQGLGDLFRLQSDFRMNSNQRYGFLTLLPTQSERIENRQSSFNPREKLTLGVDYNWLKASVFTEINANRLHYTASPEQNTTQWNNNFGMRAEITYGNFVFTSNITERTSRGYTIGSMNRDILRWDGSIVWKILKNKARLTLEFNDILNNEDGRWSQQSAYQQITSWNDFRHHYVGINFNYHLDAKKKD
jgi:hypothetical protein